MGFWSSFIDHCTETPQETAKEQKRAALSSLWAADQMSCSKNLGGGEETVQN